MSYTVLARRYRSRSFDELVGQQTIARTLRNAIEQDRVAHAYLFVGTRGVGKTSLARVFAKELNAGGDDAVAEAIMTGQDTDVIEIDAASNSKVDETRELIAGAIYRPLRGRRKIYIIDEVHMLSAASFNALLKTLEEPPEHVMFMLCTTESHKVPATIQSRCQRFDFRNLSADEIATHLGEVIAKESMEAEPDAIATVARLGAGSMRDALSILDRVMAACPGGEAITVSLIERVIGLAPRERIAALVDAVAAGDARAALEASDELQASGVEIEQMLSALAGRFRDLMVLRACGADTRLVDLSGPARERAVTQSGSFDESACSHMIALCESVQRSVKVSSSPRALVDALMVRLSMTERVANLAPLLEGSGSGGGPARKKA
jgi:DNA polymerase-3 subunit gamma/tau